MHYPTPFRLQTMPQSIEPIRVVVLGGGFAGLAFCKALDDSRFSITLIDRQNHHLFQPLLYQVASAGLSAPEIAQPIRSILSRQKNVTVLMEEVTGLNLESRQVLCGQQSVSYDRLIIALGVQTGYFGHPEWAAYAPGLKSLDDATRIRREVLLSYEKAEARLAAPEEDSLLTTVVVGGGPTGVEMAGALAELAHKVLRADFRRIDPSKARIVLVEAGPRLLSMFDQSLSDYTAARLEKLGVRVLLGAPVSEVGPGFLVCGGERIAAATIIWAAGTEAGPLTRSLGLPVDRAGRLEVCPDLSLPGHPEVFAVGDIATLTDKNGVRVPALGSAAMQMGPHVARVLREDLRLAELGTPVSSAVGKAAFAYLDRGSMATIGRRAAVVRIGQVKFRGWFAWATWLFVHLLLLVGFRNKVAVFLQWIYAYLTYKRGARIITGLSSSKVKEEVRE